MARNKAKNKAPEYLIRYEDAQMSVVRLENGNDFFTCIPRFYGMVMGMIWGQAMPVIDKKGFLVHHIYVPEYCRRCGIATYMRRRLFEDWEYDFLMTPQGTKDGKKSMSDFGYELDSKTGMFIMTKKSYEKRWKKRKKR